MEIRGNLLMRPAWQRYLAWLGGFRPGIVSALLSTLALQLLWSKAPGLLHVPTMADASR